MISLCMIVKDEEEVLGRCLRSVQGLADEIVVTDTGSSDRTVQIAEEYGARVEFFPWQDDFSAARNFSFSKGKGDYLFWLDADDVLPFPSQFDEVRAALARDLPDFVSCPYEVAFDETGTPSYTFYRERFLKRQAGFLWEGRVHECIAPRGKKCVLPLTVRHLGSKKERSGRNLAIYRRQEKEGAPFSPRDLFYYGRELCYHGLWAEAEQKLSAFLGGDGWYVNKIEACKFLSSARAARGDRQGAKEALLHAFSLGEPRASVLCALAEQSEGREEKIFWWEAALLCRDHSGEGDFEQPQCRGLLPLLALTRLYYEQGDGARALACHRRAEVISPDHPAVKYNRAFFRSADFGEISKNT